MATDEEDLARVRENPLQLARMNWVTELRKRAGGGSEDPAAEPEGRAGTGEGTSPPDTRTS